MNLNPQWFSFGAATIAIAISLIAWWTSRRALCVTVHKTLNDMIIGINEGFLKHDIRGPYAYHLNVSEVETRVFSAKSVMLLHQINLLRAVHQHADLLGRNTVSGYGTWASTVVRPWVEADADLKKAWGLFKKTQDVDSKSFHSWLEEIFPINMTTPITDGDFATFGREDSRWAILTHEGTVMKPALCDGVLALEISGTHGANWHGELRYAPFAVAKGEVFTVSFAARARRPFTFSVWLGQVDAPYASLVPKENHFGSPVMTTEWQSFSHTWRPCVDEERARLNFALGQIDNVVELRGVELRKGVIDGGG